MKRHSKSFLSNWRRSIARSNRPGHSIVILKIGRSNHIQVKFVLGVLVSVLCAGTGISNLRAQQKDSGAGEIALKKGDYETSLKQLNARLGSDPNDQLAQRNLLRVYLETGRFTEAETAARKFVTKNPQAGLVRHELGEALAATGRYSEAAVEFER